MTKPMGTINKNNITPAKGSPKRTVKKITERFLLDQQKVDLINEKPQPDAERTAIRNRLIKKATQNVEQIQNTLAMENGQLLLTETGEYIIWD